MCFYVHTQRPEPIVATEDILVYKFGKKDTQYKYRGTKRESKQDIFRSPYQKHFHYLIDKITKIVKFSIAKYSGNINYIAEINRGYHSWFSYDLAKRAKTYRTEVALFIIPKGTKFYYDPKYAEIVAERIIYVASGTKKYIKKFRENGAKLVSELKLKANSK